MRRALAAVFAAQLIAQLLPLTVAAIVPPRNGGPMPQWYYDRLKEDRNAFQFENAWIQKARRIKQNREQYIAERGFYHRGLVSAKDKPQLSVTGTVQVPVMCSKFSNTGADPFPVGDLQTKLFDGPDPNQTLTEMYNEMSYGDVNMTGTVTGWVQLPNNDTYYEGPPNCNGLCGSAKLDEYVTYTLNDQDPSIDFGQYDNDGPDGVPNSGDDDGYVDFVAFVHPEYGAECGGGPFNIWSHRWTLAGLLGAPYTTNDARTGGGFIKINDYTIQPIYNCDGSTLIDIGVFAHEFGHAFGLPDLYDTVSPYSAGCGEWCLMASGSWQSTDFPSHMSAWCKSQLGWNTIVDAGEKKASYNLLNVEFNRPMYRLSVMHERWRRLTDCAINGSYSMRCGLLAAEAAARNFAAGDGYGNGWNETVRHEFTYDGNDPVTMTYNYTYDSEPAYDYTYLRIDVNGTESTILSYDNTGSGSEVVDLTPYLTGTGAGTYTLKFVFESDVGWSDEDGDYASTCGPFVVDDITVTGGGENYSTDFETREDGWYWDATNPAEYFAVENRQPVGSDQDMNGGVGGLMIWHINEDAAYARANTGGASGNLVWGVYPEQADGLFQLDSNSNRGDGGDPFPGTSSNTTFNNGSTPNSLSDDGLATNACVINISASPGNGDPMTADMSGGYPLPSVASHTPNSADNDAVTVITVDGAGFVHAPTVELTLGGETYTSSSVEWLGKDRIVATIDITGATAGAYDVTVTNPGGGCDVTSGTFTINDVITGVGDGAPPAEYRLGRNYPNPFNPSTTIPYELRDGGYTTLRIYNVAGQLVRTLVDENEPAGRYAIEWDGRTTNGTVVPTGIYFYKLVSGTFEDVRKLAVVK